MNKKEYNKKYRDDHKDTMREYMKVYKQDYKEYCDEYNKEYYMRRRHEQSQCPCGGHYSFSGRYLHYRTKKHIKYTEKTHQMV